MNKLVAEAVGTFALVFLAVGAAVFGIAASPVAVAPASGVLGVALAFGLVLMALAYALGPTSGCHINPAVTLAMVIRGRLPRNEGLQYVGAQVVGAIAGAAVLKLLVSGLDVVDQTGALGSNTYEGIGIGAALVAEVVLTFLFVLVVLLVTDRAATVGAAGLAIGAALAAVHLVGIPLTGTSVNPARSIGPALFAGTDVLSQVWLFIVAPLVGGALAAVVAPHLRTPDEATQPAA